MTESSIKISEPPDGGRGWLIVAAAFCVYSISGGIFYIQGILYPEFVQAFEGGEVVAAWICSILSGLTMLTAMVAGWFLEMVGHRIYCIIGSALVGIGFIASAFVYNIGLFIFTYSITLGIGMGIQYLAAVMITQTYFTTKRSLATGIMLSGAPFGGVIWAPLAQFFINVYGWRATLALVGAISLNGCALGYLFVPPNSNSMDIPEPPKEEPPPEPRPLSRLKVDMGSVIMHSIENMRSALELADSVAETETRLQKYLKKLSRIFDFSVLKQGIVQVVLLNWFLWSMGYMVPYVFLPLSTAYYGISPTTTAQIISVIGISDFIGRIVCGVVGNCQCINRIHLFAGSSIISGTACILSQFAGCVTTFYIFAVVFGFSIGCWVTISTVCLAELLGVDKLARAYGIMQVAAAVAFFSTSPIHASMLEASGSLAVPFTSAGIMQIAGSIILTLYYYTCYKRTLYREASSIDESVDETKPDKDFDADAWDPSINIVVTLPTDVDTDPKETDALHCEVHDIAIVA